MARSHGLEVQLVEADWRRGADIADLRQHLAADTGHAHQGGVRRA